MILANCEITFLYVFYYSILICNTDCSYNYLPENILQEKYYRQVAHKLTGGTSLRIEFNSVDDCLKSCEYLKEKCEGINADMVTKVCFLLHSITGDEDASPGWTTFSRHQVTYFGKSNIRDSRLINFSNFQRFYRSSDSELKIFSIFFCKIRPFNPIFQ